MALLKSSCLSKGGPFVLKSKPACLRLSVQSRATGTDKPRPTESFNEGFASVRRLVDRDKKEFINPAGTSTGDILDKFVTEFGDGNSDAPARQAPVQPLPGVPNPFDLPSPSPSSSNGNGSASISSSASASTSSSGAASSSRSEPAIKEISASTPNPFKSSVPSPFGAAPVPKPFRSAIEPKGLSPDMGPDFIEKDKPFDFLANVTTTSVVLVLSFSTIIGIMLATFWVVLNAGGISIAGVD